VVVLVAKTGGVLVEVGDEGEGVANTGEEGGGIVTFSLGEGVLEGAIGRAEAAVVEGVGGAAGAGGRDARHG
jgi:hypothetical protein